MLNKQVLIIGVLSIVIVVASALFLKERDRGEYDVTMGDSQEKIEMYLEENISELSPEKEVLGGKFYVTSIVWDTLRTGVIEYEDGHIALRAEFQGEVSQEGIVNISEFLILPR